MAGEADGGLKRGGGIDWEAVRRRLHASDQRLRRVLEGDPALFERLLDERTEELSRPAAADAGRPDRLTVLVVAGAEGRYALPVEGVRRIKPVGRWTPLPGAPPHILGLRQYDGERHVLLDLDALIHGTPAPGGDGLAVLLRHPARHVALRVRAAEAIEDVDAPAGPEAAPAMGRHARALSPEGPALLDLDSVHQRAHWGHEA